MIERVKAQLIWLRDFIGDDKFRSAVKNTLLLVFAAMTAFGMIAPETATRLRDAILGMAL